MQVFVHHWFHWIFALLLIAFGPKIGRWLERYEIIYDLRYAMYRLVQHPWPLKMGWRDVVVVAIDDDSYYHGVPSPGAPINRRYLAELVNKLVEFDPAVIALDFNFLATDPTGKTTVAVQDGDKQIRLAEDPAWAEDMLVLLQKLRKVAPDCAIVLPTMIAREGEEYVTTANDYDGFEFPNDADVNRGYIQLADDVRTLPPELPIKNGPPIVSFSIAAVQLYNGDALKDQDLRETRFCSFILRDPNHEVTAKQVLGASGETARKLKQKMRHKIVIIGADWHSAGYKVGPLIDSYRTPVGELPGVLVHANYIQAFLSGRSFRLLGSEIFEWTFGFLLAWALVWPMKMPRKIIVVALIILIPLILSYLILQQFGIYCDMVIVDLLLLGHIAFERIFLPRR
ncbi:MAG: CHASE2 domain-containing protein [Pirellulales bacterium]